MKRLLVFSYLFSVFLLGFSQVINLEPGKVYTQKGDTLSGFLIYKGLMEMGSSITFKPSKKEAPIVFEAAEIRGFRYDQGGYYLSKTIEVEGQQKTVFLEYLIEGEANLYLFRDENGFRYYIELAQKEELQELSNDDITTYKGEAQYVRKSQAYKQRLKTLMQEVPEIQEEIMQTSFDHKSLIDLAVQYHDYTCEDKDKSCIVHFRKQKLAPSIGIHFGSVSTYITARANGLNLIGPTRSIGLSYLNANFFGRNKRTHLELGLTYHWGNYRNPTLFRILRQQGLIISSHFSYRPFTNSFSPIFKFGVDNYLFFNRALYDNSLEEEIFVLDNLKAYQLGASLGAGVAYTRNKYTLRTLFLLEVGSNIGLPQDPLEANFGNVGINFGFFYLLE